MPSWGKMIANGQIFLATEPLAFALIPSACLFILIITLNLDE